MIRVSRRAFLGGAASTAALGLGLGSLGALVGCGASRPETPLAHLYGKQWVSAAYEMHGKRYLDLQTASESRAGDAYALIAQKGVTALDALQSREVPFHIRVDGSGERFEIERRVPERLMFTADMSEADRTAAEARWNVAQEHLHTDYEEIRRLDWALTSLFEQVRRVRSAIERGRDERFEIVRQVTAMKEGTLPFELPYQVTPRDYETVLLLLLERLDDDCVRLARTESAIVTVGLTARSTDAGSGSLSSNLYKVLVAVSDDAKASTPRPARFPDEADERARLLARGRAIYVATLASPDYVAWKKNKDTESLEQVGGLLAAFDQVTHLNTSAVFRQVLAFYRGNADYLSYVKAAVAILPIGDSLGKTLTTAIDTTEEARKNGARGLLNVATDYGRSRLDRQLAFYREKTEVKVAEDALASTGLLDVDRLAHAQ